MNFFNSLLTAPSNNDDSIPDVIVTSTPLVIERDTNKSVSVALPTLPKTVTTKGRTAAEAAELLDAPSQITAVKNSPSAIGLKFDTFDDVEQYFKDVSEIDLLYIFT